MEDLFANANLDIQPKISTNVKVNKTNYIFSKYIAISISILSKNKLIFELSLIVVDENIITMRN